MKRSFIEMSCDGDCAMLYDIRIFSALSASTWLCVGFLACVFAVVDGSLDTWLAFYLVVSKSLLLSYSLTTISVFFPSTALLRPLRLAVLSCEVEEISLARAEFPFEFHG